MEKLEKYLSGTKEFSVDKALKLAEDKFTREGKDDVLEDNSFAILIEFIDIMNTDRIESGEELGNSYGFTDNYINNVNESFWAFLISSLDRFKVVGKVD